MAVTIYVAAFFCASCFKLYDATEQQKWL